MRHTVFENKSHHFSEECTPWGSKLENRIKHILKEDPELLELMNEFDTLYKKFSTSLDELKETLGKLKADIDNKSKTEEK